MDLVFAVRQPLSAPTWAKPIVISPSSEEPELEPPQALSVSVLMVIAHAAIRVFFTTGLLLG